MSAKWTTYLGGGGASNGTRERDADGGGGAGAGRSSSSQKHAREAQDSGSGGSYQPLGQPLLSPANSSRHHHHHKDTQNLGDYRQQRGGGGYPENQELLGTTSPDYWRESSYSSSSMMADLGPSPRTSTSSQAPSSRPMLQNQNQPPSPDSSANHSTTNAQRRMSRLAANTPSPGGMSLSPLNPPSAPFLGMGLGRRERDTPSPVSFLGDSREGSPAPPRLNYGYTSGSGSVPILGAGGSGSLSRNMSYENGLGVAGGTPMNTLPSDASNVSLSVNYLPTKFSSGMLNLEAREGARRRRGGGIKGNGKNGVGVGGGGMIAGVRIPKMGGGREAFRAGEARMAGEDDEDEDDEFRAGNGGAGGMPGVSNVSSNSSSGVGDGTRTGRYGELKGVGDYKRAPATAFGKLASFWNRGKGADVSGASSTGPLMAEIPRKKMRWNRFKWTLSIANALLSVYSCTCLVVCLLTWFDAWTKADIVRVGNTTELVISTVAALMGLFTSLVGWAGLLMNNRMFLAIYTFLCWVTFIFLVVPGYITYKKRTFNLEGKINAQWSRNLGAEGRLRIQDQLSCCGYYSPYVEATISQTCYSRSLLEGCKRRYIEFEDGVLKKWYTAVFALVPVHLVVMVVGLLCSNHVTYRFGKGMMPKAYRLSLGSMGVIMDQYAQQLAEQYGNEIAGDVISKSKSSSQLGMQLDGAPKLPYLSSGNVVGMGMSASAGTSVTKVEPYGSGTPPGKI